MKKQIIQAAFTTSPILSFMVLAPIYIAKSDVKNNFLTIWGIIFFVTLACWLFNYLLLKRFNNQWTRVAISSCVILLIGPVFFYHFSIIHISFNYSFWKLSLIRSLIIININLVINIYIFLISSKEKQLILNNNIADLRFANLEANYKLLKEQINPHFLFNALSTLKALIKRQPEAAQQYVILLADLMRSSIDFNNKSIKLNEELKLCDNYIALQKVSYGEAVQYSTEILEEFFNKELPYFALVSLLENAIKHNSFSVEKPININIFTDENYIVVQNNKQPKVNIYSDKTGLMNINERSKILNGNEIQIIENEIRFTVKIKLL